MEGVSDQIAVETLASLQGRDLAAEDVVVVPIGGAHAVARFLVQLGPSGAGVRIIGLCDAIEERYLCGTLARAGYARPTTRSDLERDGFFVCDRDLEDKFIRAVGPEALEALLADRRDLVSFRTLQKQAA